MLKILAADRVALADPAALERGNVRARDVLDRDEIHAAAAGSFRDDLAAREVEHELSRWASACGRRDRPARSAAARRPGRAPANAARSCSSFERWYPRVRVIVGRGARREHRAFHAGHVRREHQARRSLDVDAPDLGAVARRKRVERRAVHEIPAASSARANGRRRAGRLPSTRRHSYLGPRRWRASARTSYPAASSSRRTCDPTKPSHR